MSDPKYITMSDGAYIDEVPTFKTIEEPKTDGGGKRLNNGKVPLSMVPTSAMYAIARVFEAGSKKYEKDNWRRGMKHSIPYECALRHLSKYFEGEDRDEETGELHLAHALTNIAMLIEYQSTCPELDDRFKGKQSTYKDFEKPQILHVTKITDEDLENMHKEHLKK